MELKVDRTSWSAVRFGDVAINVNESVRHAAAAGVERAVGLDHLDGGRLEVTRWNDDPGSTTFTKRARPGHTLFGKRRAYQRKAAWLEFDAVVSGDILVFESKPDRLSPRLLPFIVQSEGFHSHALATSAGSLSPRTNWKDLASYEFLIPPIDQQQRLSDLMWSAEQHSRAVRGELDRVARLVGDTCRAMLQLARASGMHRLLTEVTDLRMGRQKAPRYAAGVAPMKYLRVANIGNLEFDFSDVEKMDFVGPERDRYCLQPGDLVVTEGDIVSASNVGRPALFQGEIDEIAFQNTLVRIRPHEGLDPSFLLAIWEGMRLAGEFAGVAGATTVAHLGLKKLSAMSVPVPSREVQLRIAQQIESVLSLRASQRAYMSRVSDLQEVLRREIVG